MTMTMVSHGQLMTGLINYCVHGGWLQPPGGQAIIHHWRSGEERHRRKLVVG